ncbi:MAG: response regulator transcription factor [Clostridiales bacterium]|nr:response regulator transcription factor [Clostridiales bacterium]
MNNTIMILNNSEEKINLLKILFENEGYNLISARSGPEAAEKTDDTIDLIIMDVELEGENGFMVCKELREKTNAPIIIISRLNSDSEKGFGFSAGADDYLTEPFSYNELTARTKAHIRRYCTYKGKDTKADGSIIHIKNLTVDMQTQLVTVDDRKVSLTTTEYNMLVLMLKERKKVFSFEEIYDKIWGEPYFYKANNTIMVHILKLRKKIEANAKKPEIIKTAWGKGYYID